MPLKDHLKNHKGVQKSGLQHENAHIFFGCCFRDVGNIPILCFLIPTGNPAAPEAKVHHMLSVVFFTQDLLQHCLLVVE